MWAVFAGRTEKLPPDWTSASTGAVFGSATLDASATGPGPERTVRAVCLFGSVELRVPPGSKVQTDGFSLLGSCDVDVTPGDGPSFRVRATTLFGSTDVKEARAGK